MEKFSVLMSVYKNENPSFLRESLDSVLNNTVPPDEIVMVKDGPLTRELDSVLDEYQRKTGLFHFVIHEENKGLGIALRNGLLKCKNEIIARMDTDDICDPKRFEKQLKYFEYHPEIAAIGSNVTEFSLNYRKTDQVMLYPSDYYEIIKFAKRRNPMRHPSIMFKKNAVISCGNYRDFLWFEDYDLCVRMIIHGYKMVNIQEILLHCRAGKNLFERRGGVKYLKQELKFQYFLLQLRFIDFKEFLFNCLIRAIVRMLPNVLRAMIYKNFLRVKA